MGLFGGPKGARPSSDSSESEEAAQDILDAITDGDAKALDLALKRHYELCESGPEEDAESESSDMMKSKDY